MTTTYGEPWRALLAAAYVVGPIVTVASALAFLMGGRNPEPAHWGSATEGLIGIVGFTMLIPVFVHLAARLRPSHPRLAVITVLTALFGFAGGGIYQMTLRVAFRVFVDAGVDDTVLQTIADDLEAGTTTTLLMVGLGPLIPLTSVAIGVGYLRGRIDRRLGWQLTGAGALFFAGQALTIGTEITYTAALVLWAVALVPIGLTLRSATAPAEPGPTAPIAL